LGSILDDEDYAEKELENQAFFRGREKYQTMKLMENA